MSHSLDVDASTNRPSVDDGVRDRFHAAWRTGNAKGVRAALADDAVLTLPNDHLSYSPTDLESTGATGLFATTIPSLIDVGSDGRVRAVTLTPLVGKDSEASRPASPMPGAESLSPPSAWAHRGLDPRSILGWSTRMITTIAVVIGTLAAAAPILDAVYGIWPALRPEGPAAALGKIVDNVQLEERRVPCGERIFCNLVSFDLQLIGYTGAKSFVEWAMFDPATLRRVPLTDGVTENQPGGTIQTEASSDRFSGSLPIPIPLEGRCVIVRVYVYDDTEKTRVDYGDTPPFHTHSASESCSPDPSSSPRDPES